MSFARFSPLDPDEVDIFTWDFTTLLAPVQGDTIASVTGVVADSGDNLLTISNVAALGTAQVVAVLSTPTLGVTYAVRARIVTTFGRTLDLTGTIHCQEN
jgi:hypothetical protein